MWNAASLHYRFVVLRCRGQNIHLYVSTHVVSVRTLKQALLEKGTFSHCCLVQIVCLPHVDTSSIVTSPQQHSNKLSFCGKSGGDSHSRNIYYGSCSCSQMTSVSVNFLKRRQDVTKYVSHIASFSLASQNMSIIYMFVCCAQTAHEILSSLAQ